MFFLFVSFLVQCARAKCHRGLANIIHNVYRQHLHIVFYVNKMSEPEKRTAISIYLTPRAYVILRAYNQGSCYGSLSRTVEEMILAFESVYENMQSFQQLTQSIPKDRHLTVEEKAGHYLLLLGTLLNISNAISRLQPERNAEG